jgi:hypothetical protein
MLQERRARFDAGPDQEDQNPPSQTCSTVPGRASGKVDPREPRLDDCLQRRLAIVRGERLRQEEHEARVVVEMIGDPVALDADACLSARPRFSD